MIHKPFEKLEPGEKLYMVKPLSIQIVSGTVVKSCVHPKSLNQQVWFLEMYKPTQLEAFKDKDETLKLAKDNFGANTTLTFLVNRQDYMVMVMLQPIPTIICTEENTLQEWINKNSDKETMSLLTQLINSQKKH